MRAVIFGNGEILEYDFCREFLEDSFVVCCDGGLNHAKKLGIVPHYIVGDLDSVSEEVLNHYKDLGVPIEKFPEKKDETDLKLGVEFAVNHGADEVILLGAIGSRIDHTLANMQLLYCLLKKGIRACIGNEKNKIWLIDKEITLTGEKGDLVSLIPLSMEAEGVTTYDLAYELKDYCLKIDDSITAVSNVMLKNKAKVTIKKGYLFVMQCKD